jgi:two-component system CheB/CheR fusion protein
MATNEELQSTNEELQSVNEELYAVNAENAERIDLLNRTNVDLDTLSRATRVATVFLDADLRLTRFTLEATQLFGFRETDLGRGITEFSSVIQHPEFLDDLRRAVREAVETTREVVGRDACWYQVRVLPCANPTSGATRAVATFIDISSLRDASMLQAIVDSLPEQVAVLDRSGLITQVNAAWRRFAEDNGGDPVLRSSIGTNYLDACVPLEDDVHAQRAAEGLRAVLEGQAEAFTLRYPCDSPAGERWFLMHVRPLARASGGAVVSHVDITHLGAGSTGAGPAA